MVAIGVFNGALCLANATQAADGLRLRDGRCFACPERIGELLQDVLSPGEVRVAGIRDVPEGRESSWKALWFGYGALSSSWETRCHLWLATLVPYTGQ